MTTSLPCVSLFSKLFFPLLIAGSLLFPRNMDAQTPCECTNCPQFMPDFFVGDFNLTVQGATNPMLGQNGQGVCGVIVHWDHTAICDISITLTSPSGQAVTLVGPIGLFCTTNGNAGTDWNVTFLPCMDPAVSPDPGFSATWDNNQNWGANNNYTGSYYPFSGCLQNFSGPVNGNWTLTVNDGQANDEGNLYDYEIIFCDPSGINCFTCAAEGGFLPQADVVACQGDPSLSLSLPPSYTTQQVPAPPADFSYTYVVTNSSGVILAYNDGPDLSGYAPGMYTICGLSYYTANQNLLPNPNGTLTITQLNNQLSSGSPPFCGDLSNDCVGVTIKALPPDVEETGEVCAPNCYVYYGQDFCTTGTHTVDLELDGCPYTATLYLTVYQPDLVLLNEVVCEGTCSQNPSFPDACSAGSYQANLTNVEGCDSVVLLNLLVVNVDANIQQPVPSLGCTQSSVILQGVGSTIGPGTTYLWSASNGGNITGSVSTLNATVNAPGDYQLRVCRNQGGVFCCDSVQVTVTSSQNLPAVPVISGNNSLCFGQTETFWVAPVVGAASYTWTVPANVSILSGQGTDSIQVGWNSATGGNICVTADNACGSSAPACFGVTVEPLPAATQPAGDTLLCAGDTTWYSLAVMTGVSSWNWQINGGTLLSGNGTDSVLVVWDGNLPNGSVCAVAVGNCGLSPSSCLNVVINTPPAQPVLTGDSTLCSGASGNYTILPLNGATNYTWTAPPGGSIASGQNTTAITVDWTAAPGGNICVTASGVCGAGPQQCFPVLVLTVPVADAGVDSAVCGTVLGFSATTSVPGSNGLWTLLPGAPGTVSFSPADSVQTIATVNTSGIYLFQWTETNGMCTDSDTVQGTFNTSPQIGQIQSACDGANQNYTVTFPVSGGTPPYSIAGGTLVGNTFTSDPMVSGQAYVFMVVDNNGCSSMAVNGSVNCNCSSDAGQMDLQQLSACPGDSVTAQQQGGVLDANDIGAFVLHTGAGTALGTVLAQNTSGTFGFVNGMSYGVSYYVSYVVGDNLNGQPDPNDPCLSVAQGQPVVFYDNPVADAGADDAGCGLMLPLNGTGGFNAVLWTLSSAPVGANANISNPQSPVANVTVDQFGDYTLTYTVTTAIGCSGSDDVVLSFYESPDAGAVSFQCDGANLNYTVSFSIVGGMAPYGVNGDPVVGAIYQSAPVPTGDVFNFVVTDVNGCVSPGINGMFNCNCSTNAGTMVTATTTFCAGQPATADWNNNATLDADDVVQFILHSDAGATLGTVYATNNLPVFDFVSPLQTGVTYYISAIAGNNVAGSVDLNDPCLNIAFGTPVQWRPLPTASLSGDTSYCAGGNATLYFTGTGMYPLQITYTSGGGTPSTISVPGPQTVDLPVSPTTTTTYLLVSVSDGNAPVCTTTLNDPATVSIVPDPVADAGLDQSIGCASA
ncbi:MAG: proprotein convertase P-domain-containing protein, partial [Saprospiraceae bacterium]|nr:proprotein convertase P-domain-containing protein [Saprospiraceae bacterium]